MNTRRKEMTHNMHFWYDTHDYPDDIRRNARLNKIRRKLAERKKENKVRKFIS